jgi:hypothetical protein
METCFSIRASRDGKQYCFFSFLSSRFASPFPSELRAMETYEVTTLLSVAFPKMDLPLSCPFDFIRFSLPPRYEGFPGSTVTLR